jgi:hypothetical protein
VAERDNVTLLAQLDALLETFESPGGGKFHNVSTVDESGVMTLKICGGVLTDEQGEPVLDVNGVKIATGAVYESKMDEHSLSVSQVLQLLKKHMPVPRKRP